MESLPSKNPKGLLGKLFGRGKLESMREALEYRYRFENLISSVSNQFISISVNQIEGAIENAFDRISVFAEVDRAYIFWYSDVLGRHMEKIHEWCAPGIPSELPRVRALSMDMFQYFDARIKKLQPFIATRVADLPPEAASEKKEFTAQGVKSLIFVPMVYEGKAIGFIGFEMLRRPVDWTSDTHTLLKLISEIFINALERVRADKLRRQTEERYAHIARSVNDGLWDWDMKTNQVFFSPRWKAMLGYEHDEISDSPDEWFKRIHPEDRIAVEQSLKDHLEGKTPHFQSEHRMLHKSGSYLWMLTRGLAVIGLKGKVERMAGSQTDITSRIRFEEKLQYHAEHDSLTGLSNRNYFMKMLKEAFERSKRQKNDLFAVLFMDLDKFKAVNDSFGHLFGDQLLVQTAQRIKTCIPHHSVVARFGGDEFVILIERLDNPIQAGEIAEKIERAVQPPFYIENQVIRTSISIGIALSTAEDVRVEEDFLRNADTAMYRSKLMRGEASYVFYKENMHSQVLELLHIETDLRHLSEADRVEVHYQPIINLQTGELKGFEALARWFHPVRGAIPPTTFIPIAEETGLIIPIGLSILRKACDQTQHWSKQLGKPLDISVNLSTKQLIEKHFLSDVIQLIEKSGLSPSQLNLEITESAFVEDAKMVAELLKQIRRHKIKLHLDDFGTGYSSLSYLHQFELDALKIDRSFINRLPEKSEIVKTIVMMAKHLGLEIIAEGIELPQQRDILKAMGCDYGQGFLFAKPLPPELAIAGLR